MVLQEMTNSSNKEREVESAICECCNLTEDCTPAYIKFVMEKHQGRWLCGLCAEAVKEEIARSGQRKIDGKEALRRHVAFCGSFRLSPAPAAADDDLISAVRQILRRGLDSPRSARSGEGGSPRSPFRSAAFFSTAGRLSLQSRD